MEENSVKEQSTLNRINQKLRDWLLPGTKLTLQEETIMNIIYKILNAPGTVKLTPRNEGCYLINHPMHYYVKIQGGRVFIVNSVDSIVKDCSTVFEEYAYRAIEESLSRDIEKINNTLFNSEMKLLEKIESKVNLQGGK